VCTGLGFGLLLQLEAIPNDPKLTAWPELFSGVLHHPDGDHPVIYALLIGYVNGDARRRGMRYVMWTL